MGKHRRCERTRRSSSGRSRRRSSRRTWRRAWSGRRRPWRRRRRTRSSSWRTWTCGCRSGRSAESPYSRVSDNPIGDPSCQGGARPTGERSYARFGHLYPRRALQIGRAQGQRWRWPLPDDALPEGAEPHVRGVYARTCGQERFRTHPRMDQASSLRENFDGYFVTPAFLKSPALK
jgi:hypothetical protein